MPRVKGDTLPVNVKRTLKLAKGYYGAVNISYSRPLQQVMKSYMYAYRDCRQKNVTSVVYGLHRSTRQLA